mmetsp:Transcript_4907/g.17797  ORF Transcript_4907/g.17797 Transcript_4907/m.17797 type:complete len:3401 (-) Transcript_4907:201-10403(-)
MGSMVRSSVSLLFIALCCAAAVGNAAVTLVTSNVDASGSFVVTYTSDSNIAGYQFDVVDVFGNPVNVASAVSPFDGPFSTQGGPSNTVIAFSLTGSIIPPGTDAELATVTLADVSAFPSGSQVCLANPVFADADSSGSLEVGFVCEPDGSLPSPSPPTGPTSVGVTVSSIDSSGQFTVFYTSNEVIAGYQFDVLDAAANPIVLSAATSDFDGDFTTQAGPANTVISFSLSGGQIPTADGAALVTVTVADTGLYVDQTPCLDSVIFSGVSGNSIDTTVQECSGGTPGSSSPPPPPPTTGAGGTSLSLSPVDTSGVVVVTYTTDTDIAGYQLDVFSSVTPVALTSASSSVAGFTINSNENAIIAFSLEGAVVPIGSGEMLTFVVEDIATYTGALLCIDDVILSTVSASAIEGVTYPTCVAPPPQPSPPPPPPLSLTLDVSVVSGGTFTVSYSSTVDMAGYQFDVVSGDGTNAPVALDTNGAVSAFPEFSVSAGATGTVIAFSLSGGIIPAGSGLLVTVGVTDASVEGTVPCLTEIIFSSPTAEVIDVTYSCLPTPPAPSGSGTSLSLSSVDSTGAVSVTYSTDTEMAGFQFDILSGTTPVILASAATSLAGFTVNSNEDTVIGFSLSGSVVPLGSGELVSLIVADVATYSGATLCMSNVILSDSAAAAIPGVTYPLCDGSSQSPPSPSSPPADGTSLTLSTVDSSGSFTVLYTAVVDIAGYQLSVFSSVAPVLLGSVTTLIDGFSVSTNENNVVGFSLSGDVAPAGSGELLSATVVDVVAYIGADLCLDDVILSDVSASAITPLTLPICFAPPPMPSPPPPPPLSLVITLSDLDANGVLTVSYETTIAFAAYQFTVVDSNGLGVPLGSDSGVSAFPDFSVSAGETGTVVGFSLTGAIVPVGSGPLLTLGLVDSGFSAGAVFCLTDIIISSPSAEAIPFTYECENGIAPPSPPTPPGVIVLTLTGVSPQGAFDISYSSDIEIAGYQMDVFEQGSKDPIFLEGAESPFSFITASAGPSNVIIGFSLSNTPVPPGSSLLVSANVSDPSKYGASVCLDFVIFSDSSPSPQQLPVLFPLCEGSPGSVFLSLSSVNSGTFIVSYESTVAIGGYQMNVYDQGNAIFLSDEGSFSAIESFGLTVGGNTIIGFSLDGSTVPVGAGPLATIATVLVDDGTDLCLDTIVVADASAAAIDLGNFPACPPPQSGIFITLGPVDTAGFFSVSYSSDTEIAAYQFSVYNPNTEDPVNLASSESALDTDLVSSAGPLNTVVGFSLTATPIAPGSGLLVTVQVVDEAVEFTAGLTLCLEGVLFSSVGASPQPLAVDYPGCSFSPPSPPMPPPPPLDSVALEISSVGEDGSFEITYDSTQLIAGYQMDIFAKSSQEPVTLDSALTPFPEITVSVGSNVVIGFSLTGTPVPVGSGLLVTVTVSDVAALSGSDLCMDFVILSTVNSQSIPTVYEPCSSAPPAEGVTLSLSTVASDGTFNINYESAVVFAGYQADVYNAGAAVPLSSAESLLSDFTTSAGPMNTVIGFSLTGATIPPGSGELAVVEIMPGSTPANVGADLCLGEVVIADPTSQKLPASFPECPVILFPSPPPLGPPGVVTFSLSSVTAALTFTLSYESSVVMAAYQMDVFNLDKGLVLLSSADSSIQGITAQAGPQNTVIGFSLSGDVIPPGSGVLAEVTVADGDADENEVLCLDDVIASDTSAGALQVSFPTCGDVPPAPVAPPSDQAVLTFSVVDSFGNFEVFYDSPVPVAGYQFSVEELFTGTPVLMTGGESPFEDITVQVGPTNQVIGFSLNGGAAPAGSGLLVTVAVSDVEGLAAKSVCLKDPILSGTFGVPIAVTALCDPVDLLATLAIVPGDAANTVDVLMDVTAEVAAFQFGLYQIDTQQPLVMTIPVTSPVPDMELSLSNEGDLLIGFSLTLATYETGESIKLATITVAGSLPPLDNICVFEAVMSTAFVEEIGLAGQICTFGAPTPSPPVPPGQAVSFSLSVVDSLGEFTVSYASSASFTGYQFNLYSSINQPVALESATSLIAGVEVSVSSGTNLVVGFALGDSDAVPAGEGQLTSVVVSDGGLLGGNTLCLDQVLVESGLGGAPLPLPVDLGDSACQAAPPPVTPLVSLFASSVTASGEFEVTYASNVVFGSYQMAFFDPANGSPVSLTDATSSIDGIVANGGPSNVLVGFSLSNVAIIPGDGSLATVKVSQLDGIVGQVLCMADVTVTSLFSTSEINTQYPECPIAAEIVLSMSTLDAAGSFTISYSSNVDFAGYQMDIYIGPEAQTLSGAVSTVPGITANAGPSETVIGFSLTATPIPAGEGVLATISVSDVGNNAGAELCMLNVIVSEVSANPAALPVSYPSCLPSPPSTMPPPTPPPSPPPASSQLLLTTVTGDGLFDIEYATNVAIAGFQMDIKSTSGENVALEFVSTPINGFTASSSGNVIIAFSLSDDVVPPGQGVLVNCGVTDVAQYSGVELCMSAVLLSDANNTPIPTQYPICLPPTSTTIALSDVDSAGQFVVSYESSVDFVGYELDVFDESPSGVVPVVLSSATSLVGDDSFIASAGPTNKLIGFSLSQTAKIPAGGGPLAAVQLSNPSSITQLCLTNALVALLLGGDVPVTTTASFAQCTVPAFSPPPVADPSVFLAVSAAIDLSLLVPFEYTSNVAISSYQMSLFADGQPLEIEFANSAIIGIVIAVSGNTIVATSQGGTVIPAGSGALFELIVKDSAFVGSVPCADEVIFTSGGGNLIDATYPLCSAASPPSPPPAPSPPSPAPAPPSPSPPPPPPSSMSLTVGIVDSNNQVTITYISTIPVLQYDFMVFNQADDQPVTIESAASGTANGVVTVEPPNAVGGIYASDLLVAGPGTLLTLTLADDSLVGSTLCLGGVTFFDVNLAPISVSFPVCPALSPSPPPPSPPVVAPPTVTLSVSKISSTGFIDVFLTNPEVPVSGFEFAVTLGAEALTFDEISTTTTLQISQQQGLIIGTGSPQASLAASASPVTIAILQVKDFLPQYTQLQPCLTQANVVPALLGASPDVVTSPECTQVPGGSSGVSLSSVDEDGEVTLAITSGSVDIASFQFSLQNKYTGEFIQTSAEPQVDATGFVVETTVTPSGQSVVTGYSPQGETISSQSGLLTWLLDPAPAEGTEICLSTSSIIYDINGNEVEINGSLCPEYQADLSTSELTTNADGDLVFDVIMTSTVPLQAFEITFLENQGQPLNIIATELQLQSDAFTIEAAVGESKIAGASTGSFNIPSQASPVSLASVTISKDSNGAYNSGDVICLDASATVLKGSGSQEVPFTVEPCTYSETPTGPAPDDGGDGGSALAITAGIVGGIVGLILLIALLLFCMRRRRSSPKQMHKFASKHVEMEEQGSKGTSPLKGDISGAPLSVRVAGASQGAPTGPQAV